MLRLTKDQSESIKADVKSILAPYSDYVLTDLQQALNDTIDSISQERYLAENRAIYGK